MVLITRYLAILLVLATWTVLVGSSHAQPLAPQFSSRPDAAYTMYLNFSGFSYTGTWSSYTPGVTTAYGGQTGSQFTTQQQANIKNIWARVAEAYAPFNVNVTTVDPAVAALGAGITDLQRQNYYDATPRLIHNVIGNNSFVSAGGISFINVWANAQTNGRATNWTFVNQVGGANQLSNIAVVSNHEVGHAAGLLHQGDYIGSTRVNEYSTNNGSTSLAPIMGVGYSASRNAWRTGRVSTNTGVIQNDPGRILASNPGMGLFNDGIGRTLATATSLSLINGTEIDFSQARGVIVPLSTTNPQAIGSDNYTKGFFSFQTGGGEAWFTVNAGSQWIQAGVADPGRTLDATLRLLDANGNVLATADTPNLSETISMELSAGSYFLEVSSAGGKFASLGPNGNWASASFFDMGSYFLTGNIGSAIPEPSSVALLTAILVGLCCQRRRSSLASATFEAPSP